MTAEPPSDTSDATGADSAHRDHWAHCAHCGLPVPDHRQAGTGPWFCCLGCRVVRQLALPALSDPGEEGADPRQATLLLRLGLGIFLAINVMIASWLSYSTEILGVETAPGGETALVELAARLALLLCSAVVVLLGLPLAAGSVRSLLVAGSRRLDAQLLIVVGVFAAYGLSVVNIARESGPLYFDTAAVVLVIVTLGAHLEARAKRSASAAAGRLLVDLPAELRVLEGGEWRAIEPGDLEIGDRVSVEPGSVVPIDGRVAEGLSRIDEASLTGEPRPRFVERGDRVLAGSQNHDGRLIVTAERRADDTVLALMERSLMAARAARPPIQRLADRVAALFVPAVVVLALLLFGFHAAVGAATTGLLRALSVLLISCPCALGLAAPLATWHGLRRAAERGILIDSAATLEHAAALSHIFFDKTGTLTDPEPALSRWVSRDDVEPSWALRAAASLEAASTHPIGRALVYRASVLGVAPGVVESARQVAGRGVEGRYDGRWLRLGSARWAESLGLANRLDDPVGEARGDAASGKERDASSVGAIYLMDEEGVLAVFEIGERLRPEVAPALATLAGLGVSAEILSGDGADATARLAQRLGLPATGDLLPDEKMARLQAAQAARGPVAMVGDGVNDAAVLAAADIGISVGSASDLAQRAGNVRLLSDGLDGVPLLVELARDVRRRIRANLWFAFGFNSIGIALAALGLLTPVFAALAMVVSSVAVLRVSSRAGEVVRSTAPPDAAGHRDVPASRHGRNLGDPRRGGMSMETRA